MYREGTYGRRNPRPYGLPPTFDVLTFAPQCSPSWGRVLIRKPQLDAVKRKEQRCDLEGPRRPARPAPRTAGVRCPAEGFMAGARREISRRPAPACAIVRVRTRPPQSPPNPRCISPLSYTAAGVFKGAKREFAGEISGLILRSCWCLFWTRMGRWGFSRPRHSTRTCFLASDASHESSVAILLRISYVFL